jgi:hypothetical protein
MHTSQLTTNRKSDLLFRILTLEQWPGFCNADNRGRGRWQIRHASNFTPPSPGLKGTKFKRLPSIFEEGGFSSAIAYVGRQPEKAMAAKTPDVVINKERHDMSAKL